MPKPKSKNKGDPQKILKFLQAYDPLSDESAEKILCEVKDGRKRATERKIDFE